jgi:hypothetical protein
MSSVDGSEEIFKGIIFVANAEMETFSCETLLMRKVLMISSY